MNALRTALIKTVKYIFNIRSLSLFLRKKRRDIEKLFYSKKYSSDDIIEMLKSMGVKPGVPVIIHSSFGNFYNYTGTADELIDKLIEFVGPEGTICMPAFPADKKNTNNVFDVRKTKSKAGYLTEIFRNRDGVRRSLNQLHSVCAYGKDAEFITSEHHLSIICFDKFSPYFRVAKLGGYIINLGLANWYIGTIEHVSEAILYDRLPYFKNKFAKPTTFTYLDYNGVKKSHTMLTGAKVPYIRNKSSKFIDKYFNPNFYGRAKLSNLRINYYDAKYVVDRLQELALKGITIYSSPKFK